MNKIVLSFFTFLLITFSLIAQDDVEVNVVGFKFLDYQGNALPDDLLKTKSVVFVSVPTVSKTSPERGDWKKFATEAHSVLKDAGVDPVKYYYMDDVLAGNEVSQAIAEEMKKREIANIIILSHVAFQIKNKDAERYVIVATPFSGDENFMKNGQVAWKTQDKNYDKALKSFSKDAGKLGTKENLLINDTPEFFETIDIFKGARNASFSEDLRIDKLAVPKFSEIQIPSNPPGGVINNNIRKEAEGYNQNVASLNSKLESAFADYPFEYGLVDENMDDKTLRAHGYHFILLKLNTAGENIKQLLGYESDDIMDDYVTVKQAGGKNIFRSIPKKAPVYKYYIRHINSGDIYLGTGWDADETWHEALENHLFNLVKTIKTE